MSGPSVKRQNINTAPLPGLTDPLSGFLGHILSNPTGSNPFINQFAFQPSDLQRQTGDAYSNLLNGTTNAQTAFNSARGAIESQLQGVPGMDILNASQPIFQRNMQLGADTLRQAGPRFASNTERLVGEQGQKAIQDYNLFSQNVMESGRARQLAAAGMLGQLGQGADASILANLTGAGGFANQLGSMQQQGQGMQMNYLQNLMGMIGNLGAGPAALVNKPGGFANAMQAIGTIGGLGVAAFRPGGMGGGGAVAPAFQPGPTPNTSMMPFGWNGYQPGMWR